MVQTSSLALGRRTTQQQTANHVDVLLHRVGEGFFDELVFQTHIQFDPFNRMWEASPHTICPPTQKQSHTSFGASPVFFFVLTSLVDWRARVGKRLRSLSSLSLLSLARTCRHTHAFLLGQETRTSSGSSSKKAEETPLGERERFWYRMHDSEMTTRQESKGYICIAQPLASEPYTPSC